MKRTRSSDGPASAAPPSALPPSAVAASSPSVAASSVLPASAVPESPAEGSEQARAKDAASAAKTTAHVGERAGGGKWLITGAAPSTQRAKSTPPSFSGSLG